LSLIEGEKQDGSNDKLINIFKVAMSISKPIATNTSFKVLTTMSNLYPLWISLFYESVRYNGLFMNLYALYVIFP